MLCHKAVCWRAPANITPTEQRKKGWPFSRNINEERQRVLGNTLQKVIFFNIRKIISKHKLTLSNITYKI